MPRLWRSSGRGSNRLYGNAGRQGDGVPRAYEAGKHPGKAGEPYCVLFTCQRAFTANSFTDNEASQRSSDRLRQVETNREYFVVTGAAQIAALFFVL